MTMTPNTIIPMSATSLIVCAPHVDDEVIGCYTALLEANLKKLPIHIVYFFEVTETRKKEAFAACARFKATPHFPQEHEDVTPEEWIAGKLPTFGAQCHVLVPSSFDHHPDHSFVTRFMYGQLLKHKYPATIGYYSVDMNVPGTAPLVLQYQEEKRKALDELYPSQASLWASDSKYFLFEDIRDTDLWCVRDFIYRDAYEVRLAKVGTIERREERQIVDALENLCVIAPPSVPLMLSAIRSLNPASVMEFSIRNIKDRHAYKTANFPG